MLRIRNEYGDWVALTDGGFTEQWNPHTAWYRKAQASKRNMFTRPQAMPQYQCENARADCLRSINQNAAINAKLGASGPVSLNQQTRKCYDDYRTCMQDRIASNYPISPFEIDPLDQMALDRKIVFE